MSAGIIKLVSIDFFLSILNTEIENATTNTLVRQIYA